MSRRPAPTLADYAAIAISPALIMIMVGSLVFFLIEVFYQGVYDGRLTFIMALFVFAAVLIARIAIESGRDYSMLFAIPLGLATAVATFRLVEYSGPLRSFSAVINIGLIGLIWWCADRLTWDSTVIDEAQDASGEGLLHTAGLEGPARSDRDPSRFVPSTALHQPAGQSLLRRFVDARRRPHAPGVWVIYFSIAALPIFGFGNWFIDGSNLDSRRYAFQLLIAYVGAALGLLVTTSFLGLRRYLRQRKLAMPQEMAAAWIGTGAVMIVVLLLVSMLLPRRNAEYSVTHLPMFAGSPADLWTTEYAVGSEGEDDPQHADRTGEPADVRSRPASSSSGDGTSSGAMKPGRTESSRGSSSQGSSSQGSSSQGSSSQGSSSQGSSSQGSSSQGDAGRSGAQDRQGGASDSGAKPQPASSGAQGQPPDNSAGRADDPTGRRPDDPSSPESQASESRASESQPSESQASESRTTGSRNGGSSSQGRRARPASTTRFDPSKLGRALGGTVGQLLKLLYWVGVVAIMAFLAWRYHREIRKAVADFWRALLAFWESLFGRREETGERPEVMESAGPPPRPFADFADPFLSGMAQRSSAAEVIRYTFEALEAWGREQGVPRQPRQTPHEFVQRVAETRTGLARDAAAFGELYCRCAYGKDAAAQFSLDPLRRLWIQLREP